MSWNDAKIEMLRNLVKENLSYGEIGARLGVSRCAAIGKARRLGIRNLAKPGGRKPYPRPATPTGKRILTPPPVKVARDRPAPPRVVNGGPKPLMISLLDLTDRTCRYPIGDPLQPGFGFCGHACAYGKPYCAHHQSVSWQTCPVVLRARKVRMREAA